MKFIFWLSVILFSIQVLAGDFEPEPAQATDQPVDEDTPVELPDMHTEKELPPGDLWTRPEYSNQDQALGYTKDVFVLPKGFEERFNFWRKIYTQYTSDQGVVHDAKYVDIIYREIDFTSIVKDETLSANQKTRAKSKMVKETKQEIKKILEHLHKVSNQKQFDVSTLRPEEFEIWKKFENVKEANKFLLAARNSRLRFQLGQKDRIELGIFYSGRYLKKMEQIFREHNLPIELTRLPFVESSFNIFARSKVGASGIWQFLPRTGRQYLKINRWVDERNDPIKATWASAKLLQLNYKILGSWPLAITAYNQGVGSVKRLVNRLKTRDLVEIIEKNQSQRFGFAGENFYACFLTMLHVEGEADKYFGSLQRAPELNYESVTLSVPVSWTQVLEWFHGDEDRAKLFNSHLNFYRMRPQFDLPQGIELRLPQEIKPQVVAALEEIKQKAPAKAAPKNDLSHGKEYYLVQRGDTLYDIARNFGVSLKELMEINEITSPRKIRPGLKLIIP